MSSNRNGIVRLSSNCEAAQNRLRVACEGRPCHCQLGFALLLSPQATADKRPIGRPQAWGLPQQVHPE